MTSARDLQPGDVIRPQVVVAAIRPWGDKLVRIDLRFPGEPGMGTLYVRADLDLETEHRVKAVARPASDSVEPVASVEPVSLLDALRASVAATKKIEPESGDRPRLRGEAYLGRFPLSGPIGEERS